MTRTQQTQQTTSRTNLLLTAAITMVDDNELVMTDDQGFSMVTDDLSLGGVATTWGEVDGLLVTEYIISDADGSLLLASDGSYLTITGADLSNWVEIV